MIAGRIIGWLFTLAGLASGIVDAIAWGGTGAFRLSALGELWFQLAPDSLNLVQASIQRYLIPELWDPVLQTVLLWPAMPTFLVAGIVLLWLCRRRYTNGRSY